MAAVAGERLAAVAVTTLNSTYVLDSPMIINVAVNDRNGLKAIFETQ
jgi:hypothetical protein